MPDPFEGLATPVASQDPFAGLASPVGPSQGRNTDWGENDTPQDWSEVPPKKKKPREYVDRSILENGFDPTDAEVLAKYGVGTKGRPQLTPEQSMGAAFVAKHAGPGTFLGEAMDTPLGREATGLMDLPMGVAQGFAHLIGKGQEADAYARLREGLIQANQGQDTQKQLHGMSSDPLRTVGNFLLPIPGAGEMKGAVGFAKAAGIGGALGFLQPNPNVQYDDQGDNNYLSTAASGGLKSAAFNTLLHGAVRGTGNLIAGRTVTPAPGDVTKLGSDLEANILKAFKDDVDFVTKAASDHGQPWSGKAQQLLQEAPTAVGDNPRALQFSVKVQMLKDKIFKDQAYAARNEARGSLGSISMPRAIAAVDDAIANASNDMTGGSDSTIKMLQHLRSGLRGEGDISPWFEPKAIPEPNAPAGPVRTMIPTAIPEEASNNLGYMGESIPKAPYALEATRVYGAGPASYDHLNPPPAPAPFNLEATRSLRPGVPAYDHLNPPPIGPDVSKVDRTLSVLRTNLRKIYNSDPTGKLGSDDSQKIVNAMGEDVNSAYTRLGGSAKTLADSANTINVVYKNKWANPILRNIMNETAPEQLTNRLFKNNIDAATNLQNALTPLGREASQSLILEKIMNESGGDPGKFVKGLDKIKGSADVFFTGDSKAKLEGLRRIAQVSNTTGNVVGPLAAAGIGGELGGAPGAFLGLLGSGRYMDKASVPGLTARATKYLLSTTTGQKLLLRASQVKPYSPELQQLMSRIEAEASLGAGQVSRPPWEQQQPQESQ